MQINAQLLAHAIKYLDAATIQGKEAQQYLQVRQHLLELFQAVTNTNTGNNSPPEQADTT